MWKRGPMIVVQPQSKAKKSAINIEVPKRRPSVHGEITPRRLMDVAMRKTSEGAKWRCIKSTRESGFPRVWVCPQAKKRPQQTRLIKIKLGQDHLANAENKSVDRVRDKQLLNNAQNVIRGLK